MAKEQKLKKKVRKKRLENADYLGKKKTKKENEHKKKD